MYSLGFYQFILASSSADPSLPLLYRWTGGKYFRKHQHQPSSFYSTHKTSLTNHSRFPPKRCIMPLRCNDYRLYQAKIRHIV